MCVCVCKCTDKDLEGYKLIVNKWLSKGKERKWGETRGGVEDFNFISCKFLYYVTLFTLKNFFWPHRVACGILAPQPGSNPCPCSGSTVLTTGPPGKSLISGILVQRVIWELCRNFSTIPWTLKYGRSQKH